MNTSTQANANSEVRSWLKHGLKPIDSQRPTLIRGEELRRLLTERRARSKQAADS